MKSIRQLLQAKEQQGILSVSPETTVYDALKLMADKEIGALLVLDGEKLVGVFSERDYARKVILQGKSSKETQVREIMSDKVVFAKPTQSVEECMAVMTDKRVRHLPVMDGGRVIGVLSIGDLVKETISQKEFIIRQLENYIMQ